MRAWHNGSSDRKRQRAEGVITIVVPTYNSIQQLHLRVLFFSFVTLGGIHHYAFGAMAGRLA